MLKTLLSNPVSRTFLALLFAVTAVLGAFLTYVTSPESFGEPNIQLQSDTIYYLADSWSLAYDYLEFKFSPGTLVVPGYHHGQVVAVLLIPPEAHPGELALNLPEEYRGDLPEKVEDNLDQALIMLDYHDYNTILRDSGDTIILRAKGNEEAMPVRYLSHQMEQGRSLLVSYNLFGFNNWLLPTPQTVLLRLWGQGLGNFTYYEDSHVQIAGPAINLDFPHPELNTQFYPPKNYQARAVFYMIFLGLSAAGLIAFISGGLEKTGPDIKGEYHPLWTAAALFGAILYSWLLTGFQHHFQPPLLGVAALWLLPLLLVAAWARQARLDPRFFGLSTQGLRAGIIAALSVSVFIALGSTFTFPAGIDWNTSLVLGLGTAAVLREALLRGFCQRILSHWLHPLAGIATVSCAWALIVVITRGSGVAALPLLSALGPSLLIGYLYYRTDNLWATGLLAALLELAPMILKY
jgi:membrane protease YdiL (CAAX protease family)